MMTPEIKRLLDYADESHEAAKVLLKSGFIGFSAAQSYYTMFYLTEALLLSKGLKFSKTKLLDPKFHRRLIVAEERREDGHYGVSQNVSNEDAVESFQWAEEFMQAAKIYLSV
jgi:uncharacterized protein